MAIEMLEKPAAEEKEKEVTDLAIPLSELKRLIAKWNREEVEMSKKYGYDTTGKKTEVSKIVEYILNPGLRQEKELEDESAMKAVIFLEWAKENGEKIFKEKEYEQRAAA